MLYWYILGLDIFCIYESAEGRHRHDEQLVGVEVCDHHESLVGFESGTSAVPDISSVKNDLLIRRWLFGM